jgi:hypothetical protein
MTDHDAMLAIQELLDGVEWSPNTLSEVAWILERAGYRVRDIEDRDAGESDPTDAPRSDRAPGAQLCPLQIAAQKRCPNREARCSSVAFFSIDSAEIRKPAQNLH